MATFLSKEEILSGMKEVPVLGAPPVENSFGGSNLGGNTLDKVERILTQVNGILNQASVLRNNSLIKNAGQKTETPVLQETPPMGNNPMAYPPITATPPPQVPKKIELNEEEAKKMLSSLMQKLASANKETKNMTLGRVFEIYNNPVTRGIVENMVNEELKTSLPSLIKP